MRNRIPPFANRTMESVAAETLANEACAKIAPSAGKIAAERMATQALVTAAEEGAARITGLKIAGKFLAIFGSFGVGLTIDMLTGSDLGNGTRTSYLYHHPEELLQLPEIEAQHQLADSAALRNMIVAVAIAMDDVPSMDDDTSADPS